MEVKDLGIDWSADVVRAARELPHQVLFEELARRRAEIPTEPLAKDWRPEQWHQGYAAGVAEERQRRAHHDADLEALRRERDLLTERLARRNNEIRALKTDSEAAWKEVASVRAMAERQTAVFHERIERARSVLLGNAEDGA